MRCLGPSCGRWTGAPRGRHVGAAALPPFPAAAPQGWVVPPLPGLPPLSTAPPSRSGTQPQVGRSPPSCRCLLVAISGGPRRAGCGAPAPRGSSGDAAGRPGGMRAGGWRSPGTHLQKRGRKGEKTRSFGRCPERCRVSREICHALTATKLDPPRGAKHNTGRQNRRPFPGVLSPCPRRGWPWGDRSPRRGVGGGSGSLPWPGTRCGDRLCWRLLCQGLEITQRLLGGLLGSR